MSSGVAVAPSTPSAAQTFEALYRATRDDVYAYVFSLVRDRASAEDVTAAAFERAYRKRRGWDAHRGSERAWVFGIARNAALDELRRRGRSATLAAEPVADGPVGGEEEGVVRRATVQAALAELDGRERDLVGLKFFGELSHAELARVLGISESNAQTLLHRTLTKLRKACHES